ncbi:gyrA [Symbiodinium microadriaticum]|nr:gyrA [Symbiodinium microadriaticum]
MRPGLHFLIPLVAACLILVSCSDDDIGRSGQGETFDSLLAGFIEDNNIELQEGVNGIYFYEINGSSGTSASGNVAHFFYDLSVFGGSAIDAYDESDGLALRARQGANAVYPIGAEDILPGLQQGVRQMKVSKWSQMDLRDSGTAIRIVGDVLGKYHPHGDTAVYDTMVRMAQEWSLRYPLVDGQGNFGSVDGDSPAAMRYTEARLKRISEELLSDINKNTVDFVPNYDDSASEPSVLPSKIPNLLLNGASGIAVGMATNMAPHNLTEVVDGIIAFIDNRDITIEELTQHITAPDFPTGGIIYGYQGVRSAFETGRGRIVLRAKAEIEETRTGREQIIVTEIPYQVNKASMIEKTAQLINEKKIDGISDIRDESDRQGMRIVYELKKVVIRRTKYELEEAEKRAHILEGYLIALDNLDAVIELIRNSRDPEEAKTGLIENFKLSEIQAKAILEMRLQRLTGLEREKIVQEYEEVKTLIEKLKKILEDEDARMNIIKSELTEVRDRYGDERRTTIEHAADDFTAEDMIPDEDMVITISNDGYIKRTPLVEYRTQSRGGVGSRAVKTKADDFTEHLFIASAHNYLLIFTEFGKVFWRKVWEIPEGSKTSKGLQLVCVGYHLVPVKL